MEARPLPSTWQELRRNRATVPATLLYVLVLLPYFVPVFHGDAMYWYADLWAPLGFIGIVTAVCTLRIPGAVGCRERWFWISLAAGFGCWFAGRLLWTVFYDYGLAVDLAADFLFAWLYVGILIALELDPDRPEPSAFARQLRRYMIAGGSVLIVATYAYFALIPALVSPAAYESWKPAAIGSALFDFYVSIRLYIRFRGARLPHWRRTYGWMTAGFVLWTVTDAMHVFWLHWPVSIFDVGSRADLAWYVPYALFAVGVLSGRARRAEVPTPWTTPEKLTMSGPLGGTPLMAYVFALALVHVLLEVLGLGDPQLRGARSALLVGNTVVLAFLVFRTHHLILRENRRLSRDYEAVSRSLEETNQGLEMRVQQRTSELRKAEARMRALVQAVPDGLVLVDLGGVVKDVFPGRDDNCDVGLSSSRGRLLADIFPAAADRIEEMLSSIRCGEDHALAPMAITDDSDGCQLELRFGRCGDEEILLQVQDVTERRAFEASLLQSQKLESLGILAGGVAHDFNNLLAGILGNARLAHDSLVEEPEIAARMETIVRAARRASQLTDNLLAYAGEAHIELERLDLARLLHEIEPLLTAAVPKRARFSFEVGHEPQWIDGNEAQLTQVALNLVRNAAEALVGGTGEVVFVLDRHRVSTAGLEGTILGATPDPGEFIRLRVRDTGCGIPAESRSRIFDPFFTSKAKGRGLGLSATLGIASHHGAALTLDSAPERGTIFTLFFAAREEPAVVHPATPVTERWRGEGTVLVADDDEDAREVVAATLGRLGFKVLEAADGIEALARAEACLGELKAVFLDFSMPDLDGVEVRRRIRAHEADLPVVLMSGYGSREALAGLPVDSRTAFLHKPFDPADLAVVLRERFALLARVGEA